MIVLLLLVLPVLFATWFCYWFMGSLGQLWNRASRIASLICPLLVAVFLSILARAIDLDITGSDLLGLSGERVHIHGGVVAAVTLALAFLLILPTLVVAFIAGSIFKNKTASRLNRRA